MSTSDSIALSALIVSAIGVFVTYIFSRRVWKVSKESTEIAKLSLEMTLMLRKDEERKQTALKEEYKRIIKANIDDVIKILEAKRRGQLPQILIQAPNNCGLSTEILATYFTKEEREIINKAWDDLANFVSNGLGIVDQSDSTLLTMLSKMSEESLIRQFYEVRRMI